MKHTFYKKICLALLMMCHINTFSTNPRISIITPFTAQDPIDNFLKEITDQLYFSSSELILITTDPAAPALEALGQYQYAFLNIDCIIGKTTDTISQLFNQALQSAQGTYITFMRPEDHRDPSTLQAQIETLDTNPTIDVVYSDYYTSYSQNTPTDKADNWYLNALPEFSPQWLYRDIPGPHSMWRKSLHEKEGYLKEDFQFWYLWEFWNRCGSHGILFKKVEGNPGTFHFNYFNQKKILFTPEDFEKSYEEEHSIQQRYGHLWTSIEITEKSFVIVTTSYKNKDWYKRNLDSIFNQNYTNYRIIYIDDRSPDCTGQLVKEYTQLMQKEDKLTLIINQKNVGALENIYNAVHSCKKYEIVLLVDGDDSLAHNDVLKHLNMVYQDPNVWLTYGQFEWFPAHIPGFVFQVPQWVIEQNGIRDYRWITSHLRTFYAGLFHKIKKEDLLYENSFYPMAWDLGIMYPMVEMAGYHIRFINEILYSYNTANAINDNKKNLDLQSKIDSFIRKKERYKPLEQCPI
jgi:Glycosyl transferase family 2